MKKVNTRESPRTPEQRLDGLKAHEKAAVTERGKTVFSGSKPGAVPGRHLRAKPLLKTLAALPMSEAEGDQILKDFAGETVF